jgi:choline oxidase
LRHHAIPTRIDLPGVGAHLLDHPEGIISFKSTKPIDKRSSQGWEVGMFARVGTEASNNAPPDLMLHVGNDGFCLQTARCGYPTAEHAFCFTPNVTQAKSQGTVRLRSADALARPRVDFKYLSDAHDLVVLREGIKVARNIAAQTALKEWVACELAPGRNVVSNNDLEAYIRQTHNTVYHPVGTCAIGSVVDTQLRVLGVENLRVADASVFVEHTTVNPNLTVYMIGERCAEFI